MSHEHHLAKGSQSPIGFKLCKESAEKKCTLRLLNIQCGLDLPLSLGPGLEADGRRWVEKLKPRENVVCLFLLGAHMQSGPSIPYRTSLAPSPDSGLLMLTIPGGPKA